jgi:hypothetical protein
MYTRSFKIYNINFRNFNGQFVDNVMKTNSKYSLEYDSLDKPYALLKHISESSRFHHQLVKTQMEQVDPLIEPELYQTLRSLAEYEILLWILSTESVKNYELFLDMLA